MFLVLLIFSIISLSSATTTTSSGLYATLDSNIRDLLITTYLPSDYDLPTNIYDWNVTELVGHINAKDPDLLYTIDTSLLFTLFPEYFIQNLPRDILIAHKLYYYLPFNDPLYCFNMTNCSIIPTVAAMDPCFGPFVSTKYDGIFVFPNGSDTFHCALRCEHTKVLFNISDDDMALMDSFYWFYGTIFLTMCIIIWMNICMDVKFSDEKFTNRTFLFHAPICLVILYTIFCITFLLPLIIGKDVITCVDDVNDVRTFGNSNPGSSTLCTLSAIFFYGPLIAIGGYTASFSFILWKQFYAPLNSICNELKATSYCKCCCNIITTFNCPVPCNTSNNNKNEVAITEKVSSSCSAACNSSFFKHFIIYLIAFLYVLFGCLNYEIQSFPPMGNCTFGGARGKQSMVVYLMIPTATFLFLATLFVPAAIMLLIRTANHGDAHIQSVFQKLKWRLLVYFLCMQAALFNIVLVVAFVFYLQREAFEKGSAQRVQCMMTARDMEDCMEGFAYWIGWYLVIGLALPFSGFGSVMLSCNEKNWKRWNIVLLTVFNVCLCKRTGDEKMVIRLAGIASTTKGTRTTETSPENTDIEYTAGIELCAVNSVSKMDSTDKQKLAEELSE